MEAIEQEPHRAKTEERIYNLLVELLKKKVYLNPNVSLASLCTEVGTNTAYLSAIFNNRLGGNFKTIINRYRIRYAKMLIIRRDSSIQAVYLHSGFVSRSVFYAAFKRETGWTPKQFLAHYQAGDDHLFDFSLPV
ncbi:MAG: AraC family transcriptional regulator [Bacteroidales bacterium]|nr:AraC family transcriptional regulator [Bacteroidales bacterium]